MNKKEKSLKHLAIIMDGNGRWAINKELPRTSGHAEGEHSLSRTIAVSYTHLRAHETS